jgi:hypothetical protein
MENATGFRVESAPVTCTLEIAKRIALEVVDRQIAEDAAWLMPSTGITATFGRSSEACKTRNGVNL